MRIESGLADSVTSHGSASALTPQIRLMIASNVRLVREGLTKSLRGRLHLDVVGVADLEAEGMACIARELPDIIVVDIAGGDVMTIARRVRQASARSRLVAFALAEVDTDVVACAEAGFSSYLPREGGANELYQAILNAANGRMHCAPHIAAAMFGRLAELARDRAGPTVPAILTAREADIIALAERGQSNKEIARSLAISDATVRNHMHNILQKLGVSRRGEAVACLRMGRIQRMTE